MCKQNPHSEIPFEVYTSSHAPRTTQRAPTTMAAPKPDTKLLRRKELGDHQYFKEEEHKRFSVLAAMRNVARMGLLRCVASRSIDYFEFGGVAPGDNGI
jgi:hypothetical protein